MVPDLVDGRKAEVGLAIEEASIDGLRWSFEAAAERNPSIRDARSDGFAMLNPSYALRPGQSMWQLGGGVAVA